MLNSLRSPVAWLGLLTCCLQVQAADVVSVSFVKPETFSDARDAYGRAEVNLLVLAQHLQALGQQRLPSGQTLHIEILDVDLAGQIRPWRQGVQDVRVLNGRADWPSVQLRYTLKQGDQVLKSGDERISDLSYFTRIHRNRDGDTLRHEKRMLQAWFDERLLPAH